MRKRVSALTLVALTLGVFSYGYSRGALAARGAKQVAAEVPQPPGWVPFEADVTKTLPDSSVMTGRMWRASSGSSRLELNAGSTVKSITIKNVPSSVLYWFAEQTGWVSQPMMLPPKGYKPIRYRASGSFTQQAEPLQGFVVFRSVSSEGDVSLMAPALNFFVLEYKQATGTKEVYSNVRLVEPESTLFEPPADAAIKQLNEPGGIIWKPKQR